MRPPTEEVWAWLGEVVDPEIPVISVVDLGIVRDVGWSGTGDDASCVVTITPTYSGCPATRVIADDIRSALEARGLTDVRLATRLSPAWTTDWLSEAGREKLRAFGIAPPDPGGPPGGRDGLPCPHCGSRETSIVSPFGSTPCKALLRCKDCLEPFDSFKRH